jgi:hypothetical protein
MRDISAWLAPAVLIASTAVANEPGMAQAAVNWKHGIAGRLDDGIKQLLPQLVNASRDGWVALDQQEFERVVWLFHREIGVLRGVLGDIGGMMDEVAAGYRNYWLSVAGLCASTIALLVWTKKLQASPNTAAYGVMLEKFIATGVNGTVSVLTITLASSVRSTGQIMATMVKKDHQFGYVAPSGQGKIDFSQATIDVNAFPSFQAPAKSGELPPGADDFDWEAPDTKP